MTDPIVWSCILLFLCTLGGTQHPLVTPATRGMRVVKATRKINSCMYFLKLRSKFLGGCACPSCPSRVTPLDRQTDTYRHSQTDKCPHTALAKKNETTVHPGYRRVLSRACTRLYFGMRGCPIFFFGQGSINCKISSVTTEIYSSHFKVCLKTQGGV